MNKNIEKISLEILHKKFKGKDITAQDVYEARITAIIFYFHDTYGLTMNCIMKTLGEMLENPIRS